MSVAEPGSHVAPPPGAPLVRFSAARYEELTRRGFFGPADKIELIDGYLVEKMPRNDPHSFAVDVLTEMLLRALPAEWTARFQFGVRLSSDTIPEPDAVVVPGPKSLYARRKPNRKDIALVIEVADSSLRYDRTTKQTIYARDRLAVYWIVNIPAQTVEVYTEPRAGRAASYQKQAVYTRGQRVPVVANGKTLAEVEVDKLFV
jgi:Uma2 family endonuclease